MNFFLDENFPRKATELLAKDGHTVFDIRGTGHEGMDDKNIFEEAQKKRAIFLTTDRDFFHTIPFLYEHHHGIVVIALSQPNTKNILEKLWIALKFIRINSLQQPCLLLRDRSLSSMNRNALNDS